MSLNTKDLTVLNAHTKYKGNTSASLLSAVLSLRPRLSSTAPGSIRADTPNALQGFTGHFTDTEFVGNRNSYSWERAISHQL